MPNRDLDTGYWSHPFVFPLSLEAKMLYIYLFANSHDNQAGLYRINLEIISFETKIQNVQAALKELEPRVQWFPEYQLIWVKNFLRRQGRSPKFLTAAAKNLDALQAMAPEVVAEVLEYNAELRLPVDSLHISLTRRECVIVRDAFICQYCHKEITTAPDYEMDHIIPTSKGGSDSYLNLATSCHGCNAKKTNSTSWVAPEVAPFHAKQALVLLQTDPESRRKWLKVFPRHPVNKRLVDQGSPTLPNVDQGSPTLPNVDQGSPTLPNVDQDGGSAKQNAHSQSGQVDPSWPTLTNIDSRLARAQAPARALARAPARALVSPSPTSSSPAGGDTSSSSGEEGMDPRVKRLIAVVESLAEGRGCNPNVAQHLAIWLSDYTEAQVATGLAKAAERGLDKLLTPNYIEKCIASAAGGQNVGTVFTPTPRRVQEPQRYDENGSPRTHTDEEYRRAAETRIGG